MLRLGSNLGYCTPCVSNSLVGELGNLDFPWHAVTLSPAGYVDRVPKQAVAWHPTSNYASHDISTVNPNTHLCVCVCVCACVCVCVHQSIEKVYVTRICAHHVKVS